MHSEDQRAKKHEAHDNTALLETQVNSLVLAAIVGPVIAFNNLEENVTVTLHSLTTTTHYPNHHITIVHIKHDISI